MKACKDCQHCVQRAAGVYACVSPKIEAKQYDYYHGVAGPMPTPITNCRSAYGMCGRDAVWFEPKRGD